MNDNKVSMGLRQTNVKDAQTWFTKNNSLNKMFWEGSVGMGESVCWKWATTSKAKNTYQNKVCKQSHYVWGMF